MCEVKTMYIDAKTRKHYFFWQNERLSSELYYKTFFFLSLVYSSFTRNVASILAQMAVYLIDLVFLEPLYQSGSVLHLWMVYPASTVGILQDQR